MGYKMQLPLSEKIFLNGSVKVLTGYKVFFNNWVTMQTIISLNLGEYTSTNIITKNEYINIIIFSANGRAGTRY